MYGHEIPTDTDCVKIRTGFVVTFADCPVYWASKLQTETALTEMESEINALSHSFRELFPIIDITKLLGQAVGLPICDTATSFSIQEDNSVALILENNFPPQFNPRIKYYASKPILFH